MSMTPQPGEAVKAPMMPINAPAGRVPEWVHLLPAGRTTGRDGRKVNLKDAQSVIQLSMTHAVNGVLPLDFDHAIDLATPNGNPAPAAGWIVALEARKDGLWGKVEWTPGASAKIRDREYRFISPAIALTKAGDVLAVLRASLTNNPNLTLVALNAASPSKGSQTMDAAFMNELRDRLGLAETADETAILEKLRQTVPAAHAVDPSKFVPMEVFQKTVAELNRVHSGVSLQAAEMVVDKALSDRKLMPWMKDWAVSLCQINKPAFDEFMNGVGPKVSKFLGDLTAPSIFAGRSDGSITASVHGRSGAGVVDSDIAANLGLSADDLTKYGKA